MWVHKWVWPRWTPDGEDDRFSLMCLTMLHYSWRDMLRLIGGESFNSGVCWRFYNHAARIGSSVHFSISSVLFNKFLHSGVWPKGPKSCFICAWAKGVVLVLRKLSWFWSRRIWHDSCSSWISFHILHFFGVSWLRSLGSGNRRWDMAPFLGSLYISLKRSYNNFYCLVMWRFFISISREVLPLEAVSSGCVIKCSCVSHPLLFGLWSILCKLPKGR